MAKVLIGPTYSENMWTRDILMGRYKEDRGITLLVKDGVVTEQTYPYLGDLINVEDGSYEQLWDYIYLGGHEYPLSDEEVTILTNAGYGAYIHDV